MKPEITTPQTVSIIINTITPTAVLSIPGVAIGYAANDAWISMIIGGLVGILMAVLIAMVCKANPGQPFVDWLESRFGKPLGIMIGLLFSVYYFNTFCMIVRQFANFISDMVLDQTPLYMLVGIMVLVAAFTVLHGLESVARASFIVLLLVMFVLPVSVCFNYDDINWRRLLPMFDTGAVRIASAALSPLGWLSEVSILLVLAPYMKRPSSVTRAGVIGSIGSSVQILLVVAVSITIFGPKLVPMMSYPFVNMVGIVEVGKFLERIEIFTVSVWGMTMYVKMAIFLYAALHCLSRSLRLRSEGHVLTGFSLLAIVTTVAAWPRNAELGYIAATESLSFLILFNVGLPALIGIAAIATRWNGSRKGA